MNFVRIVVCLLSILLPIGCQAYESEIWLVNQAIEPIEWASVSLSNQAHPIILSEIGIREKQQAILKVTGDAHYIVSVRFASGKTLTQELGYVTRGFNFQDFLVTTEDAILLNPKGYERKVLD